MQRKTDARTIVALRLLGELGHVHIALALLLRTHLGRAGSDGTRAARSGRTTGSATQGCRDAGTQGEATAEGASASAKGAGRWCSSSAGDDEQWKKRSGAGPSALVRLLSPPL